MPNFHFKFEAANQQQASGNTDNAQYFFDCKGHPHETGLNLHHGYPTAENNGTIQYMRK